MTEIAASLPQTPLPDMPGFTRSHSLHNTGARIMNVVIKFLCCVSALATIAVLFMILGYILYRGMASMNLALFTALPGPPDADRPTGLRNAIEGTLILILMASCIGVPLGMLCGIYLAEYSGERPLGRFFTRLAGRFTGVLAAPLNLLAENGDEWVNQFLRLVVDVLAGVPSIIVGLLGYELVVVPMHTSSAWAGAIVLGFMMCPIIARTTEEMLKLVPKALREASTGLGASKFQTLFRVVVPSASAGIITGVMLAVARVAGETAPLLFTVLGYDNEIVSVNSSFPFLHVELGHAFPSLTVKIYEYATSPEREWNRQAWAGMLILILLVLVLNVCVRWASTRKSLRA